MIGDYFLTVLFGKREIFAFRSIAHLLDEDLRVINQFVERRPVMLYIKEKYKAKICPYWDPTDFLQFWPNSWRVLCQISAWNICRIRLIFLLIIDYFVF